MRVEASRHQASNERTSNTSRGYAGVVEAEDRLVAREDVAPALALLDLLEPAAQLEIAALERREALVERGGIPLALDERVTEEQLACERPVEARQLHAAPGDDLDAEEGDLLVGGCRSRRLRPVRLAQRALGQVARELFRPRGIDRGDRAGEQARSLDELGGHHGGGSLLSQPRPGEDGEARAPRADVLAGGLAPLRRGIAAAALRGPRGLALVEDAEVREQPGEDRPVDRVGVGLAIRRLRATEQRAELAVDVSPLADADVVQVLGAAEPAEGARPEHALLLLQVIPEVQQAQEVARRVGEAGVQAVGFLTTLLGPLADILDRHPRDDREHVAQHPGATRLDEHAREARVDRKPRDLAAEVGEARALTPLLAHGAELDEQIERRLHAARVGWCQERERRDVAEAERQHLQDDRREARAQDLGLGELVAPREVLFGVQPDRDARRGSARATGPLLRRRLRDRLDRQPLDLAAVAVARDARRAGVDDVPDAGHGQARLRDVGREDDPAPDAGDGRSLEHPVLLGGAQAAVEGEHLGGSGILRVHASDGVRRIADLGLAGKEDEHVARRLAVELPQGGDDAVDVVRLAGAGRGIRSLRSLRDGRAIPDLDRVRPTGHLDDRGGNDLGPCTCGGAPEVLREALRGRSSPR